MHDLTKQSLDRIFNVAPIAAPSTPVTHSLPEVVEGELMVPLVTDEEQTQAEIEAQEDYEYSRGQLKDIANTASTALNRAVHVAQLSDAARAFEVVADMVRATVETHRELQALHKTSAEIRNHNSATKEPKNTVNIQQGIVFQGTSEELLRLIKPDRQ